MPTSALEIIKNNLEARQAKASELRAISEKAVNADGAPRPYDADEQKAHDEIRSQLDAIDSRVQEHIGEQIRSVEITDATASLLGRLESRADGDLYDERSMGERFADLGDELRNWNGRGSLGVFDQEVSLRAVTDATLGATSAGALTRAQRLDRIGNDFLNRRVFLTDVLPHIPVSQGSVEYVQDQSPLADLADKPVGVAEAAAKPQAGVTLAVINEPTPNIAVWANMTRQADWDVPMLRGYLDGRLRYSLKRAVDKQVISGAGANQIQGLTGRSGIVTYAPGAAEARYKSVRRAIRLGEDSEAVYEIIVLNPADHEIFDLSNDATAGIHATPDETGGLRQGPSRTVWGLTPVVSTAIASGTALLIDPMALSILDRMAVAAFLTDSHASNFTSNLLTLLLETRAGLALFDPKGVCRVTFNGTV